MFGSPRTYLAEIGRSRTIGARVVRSAFLISLRLILLVITVVSAVVIASAQTSYYFGRTKDPTPVKLSTQDKTTLINFTIPKVYMTFSENWKGGLQDVITFEFIFPSLQPLSASRTSTTGLDVVIVSIYALSHRGGNYNIADVLRRNEKTLWDFAGTAARASGQFKLYRSKEDKEGQGNGNNA